jgi:hypothetical protein
MCIAGVPALPDSTRTEIDVLCVGLTIELGCKQPHDMHPGLAAIARELAHRCSPAIGLRKFRGELVDDMSQTMDLLLAHDLARYAAGILHILVAIEYLRHRRRLRADGIPQMNREDQRVPARIVVKYGFRRCIGQDSAVPIKLAIDAHRRKGRRQRTRGHEMLYCDGSLSTVEIAHPASANVSSADRQAWSAAIDKIEVYEFLKGALQRLR